VLKGPEARRQQQFSRHPPAITDPRPSAESSRGGAGLSMVDLGAAGPKGTFRGKRAEVRGGLGRGGGGAGAGAADVCLHVFQNASAKASSSLSASPTALGSGDEGTVLSAEFITLNC